MATDGETAARHGVSAQVLQDRLWRVLPTFAIVGDEATVRAAFTNAWH